MATFTFGPIKHELPAWQGTFVHSTSLVFFLFLLQLPDLFLSITAVRVEILMLFRHAVKSVQRAVSLKTNTPPCQPLPSINHCYRPLQQRCYRLRKSSKPDPEAESETSDSLNQSDVTQAPPSLDVDATAVLPDETETKPKKPRKPRAKKEKSTSASTPKPSRVTAVSQNHHDLSSFLAYADSASLSKTSMVYLGTHYEYMVSASLCHLGFRLDRVGGASDLGIDLIGHWNLPSLSLSLPAVIQCKATTPQAGHVRELEGAMQSAPAAWKQDNTIGLLAAAKPATKGIRDALARSSLPMAFLFVSIDGTLVRQFIWNQAAVTKCGLEGVGVSLRYPEQAIALTLQGVPLRNSSAST